MQLQMCPENLTLILLCLLAVGEVMSCGPGPSGQSRKRYSRRMKMAFGQAIPNVKETSLAASGKYNGKVLPGSQAYQRLVQNFNTDIVFKDDEKTGDDRRMTTLCKERVNKLAQLVKAEWPEDNVRLLVVDAYDVDSSLKKHMHGHKSLHHEGRAVDIATSDHRRDRYPTLGMLAYKAGFDWVSYASRGYIHASVKTVKDEEKVKNGNYCFPASATVLREDGRRVTMTELRIGDKIETTDVRSGQAAFSEVIAFLDYKVDAMVDFVVIETERPQAKLVVTDWHLLYRQNKHTQQGGAVHARDIELGDYVYVRSNRSALTGLTPSRVTSLKRIRAKGAYAPLTESGTLLVDNILSSCYALVHDHSLAHWSFAPLRFMARFTSVSGRAHEGGLHWYANLLYKGYTHWKNVQDLVVNTYVQYTAQAFA